MQKTQKEFMWKIKIFFIDSNSSGAPSAQIRLPLQASFKNILELTLMTNLSGAHNVHGTKPFTHDAKLQLHIRTHTGEKPYNCLNCPVYFAQKDAMRNHMRRYPWDKPYSCFLCTKSYFESRDLRKHFMRIHTVRNLKMPRSEKLYSCTDCTQSFA